MSSPCLSRPVHPGTLQRGGSHASLPESSTGVQQLLDSGRRAFRWRVRCPPDRVAKTGSLPLHVEQILQSKGHASQWPIGSALDHQIRIDVCRVAGKRGVLLHACMRCVFKRLLVRSGPEEREKLYTDSAAYIR